MNRDGKGLRLVAKVPGKYGCGSPSWSPDGKAIAFDAHGPNFSNQHTYIINLENEKLIDLGPGGFPAWSPDGTRVAFHRQAVTTPLPSSEPSRLPWCIKRGAPFGDKKWVNETARRLDIQSTLRPRGRPKKAPN